MENGGDGRIWLKSNNVSEDITVTHKLELTWMGKDESFNLELRILIENKEQSNIGHALDTENMLIRGDNLLALKALELEFAGKVKCIYIDNGRSYMMQCA